MLWCSWIIFSPNDYEGVNLNLGVLYGQVARSGKCTTDWWCFLKGVLGKKFPDSSALDL